MSPQHGVALQLRHLSSGPLTPTRADRWNACNEIQAGHNQSTWRQAEAEFIIINRNDIKLFHFTISGDRKIVFLTYISRICLDPAAVRTNERCHATTFPRFKSP